VEEVLECDHLWAIEVVKNISFSGIHYKNKIKIFHFHQISKVLLFLQPLWAYVPPLEEPPAQTVENGVAVHFALPYRPFTLKICKDIFRFLMARQLCLNQFQLSTPILSQGIAIYGQKIC
jgi:hypothetical protein